MGRKRAAGPDPAPAAGGPRRGGGLLAAIVGVIITAIVAAVVWQTREGPGEGRDAIDLADRDELGQVVVAISRIILAADDGRDAPVAALEALRPRSLGAIDLREACVTTYRGILELGQSLAAQRSLLAPYDGGRVPPEVRGRAAELNVRAQRILDDVQQSRHRCHDLYERAAHRLGVRPARRGR